VTRTRTALGLAAGVFGLALTLTAGPPRGKEPAPKAEAGRVAVAAARDRATVLHAAYAATLESMHHHFFRRERAVLPARAMEDVFADVGRETGAKGKWIAVNTPAMSIDHEPTSGFEKWAAAELAAGKPAAERVEGGTYHRAGAIPLGAGCLSCHTRLSATTDKTPRFAGIVITIPVKEE
jgi:hypothetical protein